MKTIYLISGANCCDHILSAGFVTDKADVSMLVKRHFLEAVLDDPAGFCIESDLKNDIVTVTEVNGGYKHTYYIQTVKRLV